MLTKTIEEKKFLINNVHHRTPQELAELFNIEFNRNVTAKQILYFKNNHGLKSGIDTKFKGNPRRKEIGSEKIHKGYVYIKVAQPDKYKMKHRYIYENTYGKIPDDFSVIFADGNRRNFDIDNLILVKKRELLIMKNNHLIYDDKELTKTGIIIAQLIDKTNKKQNDLGGWN